MYACNLLARLLRMSLSYLSLCTFFIRGYTVMRTGASNAKKFPLA